MGWISVGFDKSILAVLFQTWCSSVFSHWGYYMLLFDTMHAQERIGDKWSDSYFHIFTLRNMMWNCLHMIMRVVFHPCGTPFAPCKTLENVCEQHFSQKKLGGASPTIASCVFSTQKTHLKQYLHPFKPAQCPDSTQLSSEQASKIMVKSFQIASKFESVCSVGQSSDSLRRKLLDWWDDVGHDLLLEGGLFTGL